LREEHAMERMDRERESFVFEQVGELIAVLILTIGGTLFVSAATLI
jgi:hypothetical protein